MSENPPRKKLRQSLLTNMFQRTDRASEVTDQPSLDKPNKSMEGNCDGQRSSDTLSPQEYSSNAHCSSEQEAKSDPFYDMVIDEDEPTGRSKSKGKSPHKADLNKHTMGKLKKRKHVGKSNLNEELASRRTGHGINLNETVRNKEFKEPSCVKSGGTSAQSSESSPNKATWRGCPLSSFTVLSDVSHRVPTVHPSTSHTVMIKLPVPDTGPPNPYPSSYSDIWDQHHVRMPCSPKSLYPVSAGSDSLVPRWSIIFRALQREMKNVYDLQKAILEYNSRYAEKWNFKGLRHLLEEELEEVEQDHFFQNTLPAMVNLALDLPNIVTQAPPLLTRHSTHSITLSQIQVGSLLANAFFCTFPRRNAKGGDTEFATYPDINFNRLFSHKEDRSIEKLKCLINYFRRITQKRPEGLVTFTRHFLDVSDLPAWETLSHHVPNLHVDSNGLIEEKEGLLQVDFANKYIGGGVLGLGCVQEEIRFVLSPELILSRLFTEVLDKTESLIVTGTEQFNQGSGYASNFQWTGSHEDPTKCDVWKRRLCQVVAIDALRFSRPKIQYRPPFLIRELNKVYAGYKALRGGTGVPIGVATGNWGCGAFNGNARLKALIQLVGCGYAGRDVAYFTFGDEKLRDDLVTMHIFLRENNITIGELAQVLIHYGQREWSDGSDLYHYIYHSLGSFDSDTDEEIESNIGSSVNKNEAKKALFQKQSLDSKITKSSSVHQAKKNLSSPGSFQQESEVTREENVTEEKIVQVLMECDRLVEGQKKQQENVTEIASVHKDNRLNESNESKSKVGKTFDQSSKSISEPSSLLSCLDKIDDQIKVQK